MRVLMLAQFYPPVIGGEERHVRNLSRALVRRGHEVHVATLAVTAARPFEDDGVHVHFIDSVGRRAPAIYGAADRPLALPVPDPLVTRGLARTAREVDPDVVHAHNWIVNAWLPLPSARRLPLVMSLHDYSHVCATKRLVYDGSVCSGPAAAKCVGCSRDHYGLKGPAIWGGLRAGLPVRNRTVDVFTPVSRFVGDANRLHEYEVAWQVVPNFVPDDLLTREPTPRDPLLPQGDYVFFAGDLSRQKGVHTLIEAHAALPRPRPALVLVGRAADLPDGLAEDVHVHLGWDHERVVSGFQHALLAALPSEWPDPCPTTVLEAMALGTALVTTTRGGIADMVRPEESALVVEAGSVTDLQAAIKRLMADADLRARLADGARRDVRGFLQDAVAETFEGIYASLVG